MCMQCTCIAKDVKLHNLGRDAVRHTSTEGHDEYAMLGLVMLERNLEQHVQEYYQAAAYRPIYR